MNNLKLEIKNEILKLDLKALKTTLLVTFIFGLIAHGFCFLNANFSHDCLFYLYYSGELKEYFQMGRFLRPVYQNIKCNWDLPWLNGLLSLLFLSLSIYLINDIFGINKNCKYIFFTSGIFATCTSYALLNATYIHDSDSYMLSLLFVSIGLWISKKCNNGYLLSIPFYIISCGIYQVYIQVAIFIYIIFFIIRLLDGENLKVSIEKLFKEAALIVASIVVYYVIYRFLLFAFNFEEADTYNSVSMATNSIFNTWQHRLYLLVSSEINWFLFPNANKQQLAFAINIFLSAIAIYLLVKIILNKKTEKNKACILCLTLVSTPLAINFITFLSCQYHALTLYPLYFCYYFVLLILFKAEEIFGSKVNKVIISCFIAVSLMIADNCIFSNTVYLQKELINKNTLSTITRLIDRIEQVDGYQVGKTKVAIVGNFNKSVLSYEREDTINYDGATGMVRSFALTYYSTIRSYFSNYLGYPIVLLNENDSKKYEDYDVVKKMNTFPSKDSCKMIDGVLVVKISD